MLEFMYLKKLYVYDNFNLRRLKFDVQNGMYNLYKKRQSIYVRYILKNKKIDIKKRLQKTKTKKSK